MVAPTLPEFKPRHLDKVKGVNIEIGCNRPTFNVELTFDLQYVTARPVYLVCYMLGTMTDLNLAMNLKGERWREAKKKKEKKKWEISGVEQEATGEAEDVEWRGGKVEEGQREKK